MPEVTGRLKWDQDNERYYETGADRGVLYLKTASGYSAGEAWNGLTGITESPSGAEETELFANNSKYGSLRSAEKFGCTIEAYTCPRSFYACNGVKVVNGVAIGQQERSAFGMTYRTLVGNDVSSEAGYKIHIIYGLTCSPSEKTYNTVNDSPEAATMSWEAASTPTDVTIDEVVKKTSSIEIDTTTLDGGANHVGVKALEALLYGTDAVEAAAATYKKTTDQTKQDSKTYYTEAGGVYTEFTGSAFSNGTDYYEILTPAVEAAAATDATLPTPDEVIALFAA